MSGTVRIARPGPRAIRDLKLGEVVCIRLTSDDVADLNRLVQQEQRMASQIIRSAIRAYIGRSRET